MSYDTALAVFSPDGRLLQVERAQHASKQGSLVVFSRNNESIQITIEKKSSNKMLIEEESAKLILIDPILNIYMSFSGFSPDSHVIKDKARLICRNYKLSVGEDIDIVQLTQALAQEKQKMTIEGGRRPYGITTVLFGYFEGWRIFVIEPDGNYSEYVKGAIGMKCEKVIEYLEKNESEYETLDGLFQVVQNDPKKVCSYKLCSEGLLRVEEEILKEYLKVLTEKEAKRS